MQLRDGLRMLEHDFRHEGAGLQVAAPLELEHVALGADDGALGEALEKGRRAAVGGGHGGRRCSTKWSSRNYRTVLGGTHPAPRR